MAGLILASASPRRRELLAQAGYTFAVEAADIDETRRVDEAPAEYVRRLAVEKASAIFARHEGAVVLGADTTVVSFAMPTKPDGEVLNKPVDDADAARMLRALSGRVHEVHTGIAVVSSAGVRAHVETTKVFVDAIPEADLARYIASGDGRDKAGAYGIQGYAARWIPRIEGCYFNVMGLPIAAVVRMLGEVGDE